MFVGIVCYNDPRTSGHYRPTMLSKHVLFLKYCIVVVWTATATLTEETIPDEIILNNKLILLDGKTVNTMAR